MNNRTSKNLVVLQAKMNLGEHLRNLSASRDRINQTLPVARNLKNSVFLGVWEWISVMEEGFGLTREEVNEVFSQL